MRHPDQQKPTRYRVNPQPGATPWPMQSVTRGKLQAPGNAEEHKRQETPTINPIGPTDKPHRPSTKHYRQGQPGRRITPINTAAVHASAQQQPTISTQTRQGHHQIFSANAARMKSVIGASIRPARRNQAVLVAGMRSNRSRVRRGHAPQCGTPQCLGTDTMHVTMHVQGPGNIENAAEANELRCGFGSGGAATGYRW